MRALKIKLVFVAASAVLAAGLSAAFVVKPVETARPALRLIGRPVSVSIPDIVKKAAAEGPGQLPNHLAPVLHINDSGESAPAASEAARPALETAAAAPAVSPVVSGGGGAQGFNGIDLATMEKAGSGAYKGANGGLEPPDQALCVGSGFVIEGVNLAFRMYDTKAVPLTPAIPIVQFFQLPPPSTVGPSTFVSDPRCIYDAATRRFFVSVLEADTVAPGVFGRSHNYFAVSKTSDPTKDWFIYSFDTTDDGLAGTPAHRTCPCLGDQPLIGTDANGLYISDNEFSDSEIVPVQLPPAVGNALNQNVYTLPDFRNGQAQVYALSKQKLISGRIGPVVQLDTGEIPVPAGSGKGAVWSSLQPAHSPPGDRSVAPAGGAEYFLSQLDFQMKSDKRIAVWAVTNTSSLNSPAPRVSLKGVLVETRPGDVYSFPVSADQKAGPQPIGDTCLPVKCEEEKLNANDDRMNEVMLTNGVLWSGVNTKVAPINPAGTGRDKDPRTGIMYFAVAPSLAHGQLSATMVRDGYVTVDRDSVLFPSIGASPAGHVVMGFTLSGVDYYPSAAWAQLDGLAPGQAPTVHISGVGAAPEDGFTGYCGAGLLPAPLTNLGGLCTSGIARWGDYSFTSVDEQGCIWTATEYISGGPRDPVAGNWATYITRVAPPGCREPGLTPKP